MTNRTTVIINDYAAGRDAMLAALAQVDLLKTFATDKADLIFLDTITSLGKGIVSIMDSLPPAGTYVRIDK